jgi:hypothetical protein
MALQSFVGHWTEISPSQGLYLHIEHRHRINANNTNIHALCGIQTHNPSLRASEDSSRLRPRGNCDRQEYSYYGPINCHSQFSVVGGGLLQVGIQLWPALHYEVLIHELWERI